MEQNWYWHQMPDGTPCGFFMNAVAQDEHRETSFRGRELPLAGNFAFWTSIFDVLSDREVRTAILDDVVLLVASHQDRLTRKMSRRLQITLTRHIGWSRGVYRIDDHAHQAWWSPDDDAHDPDLVRHCQLGKWSTGWQVNLDRLDVRAPLTKALTLVYSVHWEEHNGWVIKIYKIFPGEDTGKMKGDMSRKSGMVFFHRDHPGQPLTQSDTYRQAAIPEMVQKKQGPVRRP